MFSLRLLTRSRGARTLAGLALIAAVTIPGALPAEANRASTHMLIQTATPPPGGSAVTFEVVPAHPAGRPTPSLNPSGDLPLTGTDSAPTWLVSLGLLLVVGGALITALVRRVDRRRA
jgi:LPXTG-motif cell wall-anchored protein